jgi:hypothetical protein
MKRVDGAVRSEGIGVGAEENSQALALRERGNPPSHRTRIRGLAVQGDARRDCRSKRQLTGTRLLLRRAGPSACLTSRRSLVRARHRPSLDRFRCKRRGITLRSRGRWEKWRSVASAGLCVLAPPRPRRFSFRYGPESLGRTAGTSTVLVIASTVSCTGETICVTCWTGC